MVTCIPLSRATASIGVFDEGHETKLAAAAATDLGRAVVKEPDIVVGKGERVSENGSGNDLGDMRKESAPNQVGNPASFEGVEIEGVADDVIHGQKAGDNNSNRINNVVVLQVIIDDNNDNLEARKETESDKQWSNKSADDVYIEKPNFKNKNSSSVIQNKWKPKSGKNKTMTSHKINNSHKNNNQEATDSTKTSSKLEIQVKLFSNSNDSEKNGVRSNSSNLCHKNTDNMSTDLEKCHSNKSVNAGNYPVPMVTPHSVSSALDGKANEATSTRLLPHKGKGSTFGTAKNARNYSNGYRRLDLVFYSHCVNVVFVVVSFLISALLT